MLVVPHATEQKRAQYPPVTWQAPIVPWGIWPQLSSNQQKHLSQIIAEMMQHWQAAQVAEVKHDGDVI